MPGAIGIEAVPGLPEVHPGDDLARLIGAARRPLPGEIFAISQKVVSKAEGQLVRLDTVAPGSRAEQLATRLEKDPRLVELVLRESRTVLRAERGVLITETHHGLICANAGIDSSNLAGAHPGAKGQVETVALLPADPDASARRIRAGLAAVMPSGETPPAVLISDSFGRPWRIGQAEVAIGCAGLIPLDDWRGRQDSRGRELAATLIAAADQVAAAADLGRDKTSRTPVVVVSGLSHLVTTEAGPGASALHRPEAEDLFR